MKCRIKRLVIALVVVCTFASLLSSTSAAEEYVCMFDFDDRFVSWPLWATSGSLIELDISEDNAIQDEDGYSISIYASGYGVNNAHAALSPVLRTIPAEAKYLSYWIKPIQITSDKVTFTFLSRDGDGRIQFIEQLVLSRMDEMVDNPPLGATIEEKANGWYKVKMDIQNAEHWFYWGLERDEVRELRLPLREIAFQVMLPTDHNIFLIDQIGFHLE